MSRGRAAEPGQQLYGYERPGESSARAARLRARRFHEARVARALTRAGPIGTPFLRVGAMGPAGERSRRYGAALLQLEDQRALLRVVLSAHELGHATWQLRHFHVVGSSGRKGLHPSSSQTVVELVERRFAVEVGECEERAPWAH